MDSFKQTQLYEHSHQNYWQEKYDKLKKKYDKLETNMKHQKFDKLKNNKSDQVLTVQMFKELCSTILNLNKHKELE